MKKLFLLLFLSSQFLLSQGGTWAISNRTHPELKWKTLQSKNFRFHYHTEIKQIAKKGINIAETILPNLLKQIKLDTIGLIDVTLSAEDEIMNGFATWFNSVVIWVDQNDAALWLEDEKWLYQVLAHELQHVVLLNKLKTWLPEPYSMLFSGTPSWFIEGSAEYFTEKWRPYRSDVKHKYAFLQNKSDQLDPHDDGFSKLLYMSHRFADSTIIKIVNHRNQFKLFNFDDAFKINTGISLKQFEEEWRRDMSTSFFGFRAQKERYEDVGKILTLPVKKSNSFLIADDSLHFAILGKKDDWQFDESLILAELDTLKEKSFFENIFSSKKDTLVKPPKYKIKEIDNGEFHNSMSWSQDSKLLAFSKYHYDENQSMSFDIKIYDTKSETSEWITSAKRATYPVFNPIKNELIYVSHKNSVANIFLYNLKNKKITQLTNFKTETEILTPSIAPNGKEIAFALSESDGQIDIAIYNFSNSNFTRITNTKEAESKPIWSEDGKSIIYTSHQNGTLNLHKINLESKLINNLTDVGDGISAIQKAPKSNLLISTTLPENDSIKLVLVDPNRQPKETILSLNPFYWDWRKKSPDLTLPKNFNEHQTINYDYSLLNDTKLMTWFALPVISNKGFGLTGALLLTDPMMRHLITIGGRATNGGNDEQQIYASYINATFWPLIEVSLGKNSSFRFKNYDKSLSGLNEQVDLFQTLARIPTNFGERMSSDHQFSFGLQIQSRRIDSLYDKLIENNPLNRPISEMNNLQYPENAKEGILILKYRWLDKRPFLNMDWFPTQGKGFKIEIQNASKNIFGNFNYTKIKTDAYINQPILSRLIFYGRIKTEILDGKAPAQDYVGLTNDPSTYYPWYDESFSSFIQYDETNSLRGYDGVRLGNRLIFGTIEFRLPIIDKLPINVFGLSIGSLSLASINDFGNAWYDKSENLPKMVSTTGYELKLGIKFSDFALFNFAYGRAHPRHEPSKDEEYFRLSLINPY